MSALSDFQAQHGDVWATITQGDAFAAAMQLLNLEKLNVIAALTPEEIAAKGQLVLADFVGHLNHENNLAGLAGRKEFVFTELGRETYPDPIDENAEGRTDAEPPPVTTSKKRK